MKMIYGKIFSLITIFYLFVCQDNVKLQEINYKVDSLKSQINMLINEKDSLSRENTKLNNLLSYWFDEEYDGESIFEAGIENPAEFVKTTFRKRTDLIPLKPVLGGNMQYDNIQLLSREWLIADYCDGHIQGRSLVKYKLNKKKQLVFKIIVSGRNE